MKRFRKNLKKLRLGKLMNDKKIIKQLLLLLLLLLLPIYAFDLCLKKIVRIMDNKE